MKKSTFVLLFISVLGLAACNGEKPTPSSGSSPSLSSSEDPSSTSSSIEPVFKQTYFLPEETTLFVSDGTEHYEEEKRQYTYDEDLLGFTEIHSLFAKGQGLVGKEKTVYRTNADYSELSVDQYIYDPPFMEREGFWRIVDHKEYEFSENGSYIKKDFDFDSEGELVLDRVYCKVFDSNGRITLDYQLRANDEDGTVNEITSYFVYGYDEAGFPNKFESYEGIYPDSMYIDYYDDYHYDFESMTCITEFFYRNNEEERFSRDGYSVASLYEMGDIVYFDEVMYGENGEPGNRNKFGYDFYDNWDRVYSFYGGLNEEKRIVKDENGNVTSYTNAQYGESDEDYYLVSINASYDSHGSITSSNKFDSYLNFPTSNRATYVYSEGNQMLVANLSNYWPDFSQVRQYQFVYSQLESEGLLSFVGIYEEIISSFTDEALIYGI